MARGRSAGRACRSISAIPCCAPQRDRIESSASRSRRSIVGRAGSRGHASRFEADALCVGHGLVPGAEITRLLRADMSSIACAADGCRRWTRSDAPSFPASMRSEMARASAAPRPPTLAGRLARPCRAHDADAVPLQIRPRHTGTTAKPTRERASYAPFADAMADMMAFRPAQVAGIPADTVVCRCEDVTRAEIEAAAAAGARDVNQLKHFTRCGMGPCQGRMCGDVAAELLAQTARWRASRRVLDRTAAAAPGAA